MDFDELDELDPVEEFDASTEERPYGIVIYGATGYTGCLMVEHLDALLSRPGAKPMKWAIAGRDQEKLRRIVRKCKTGPARIEVSSPTEVSQMAAQCRVVLNAAGPYMVCGEDVVRACVNQVTHYVDVAGNVAWISSMIGKYHEKAKERGAMIVHAAGAVCAPDEILSYTLVQKLGPLARYREYFLQYGSQSGGTFNDGLATMEGMTPDAFAAMRDPFALGGASSHGVRSEDMDCAEAEEDPVFPLWLMPAYNSAMGSRMVRRARGLFEDTPSDGVSYGQSLSVVIRDCTMTKASAQQGVQMAGPLPAAEMAPSIAEAMRNQRQAGQAPPTGEGAPAATRALFSSEVFAVAEGENGERATARYSSGDAYEATAILAVAAAQVLVEELDLVKPRGRGGVLAPAFAMHGSTWIDRVQAAPFAGSKDSCSVRIEVQDGELKWEDLKKAIVEKNTRVMAGQARIMKGEVRISARPRLTG